LRSNIRHRRDPIARLTGSRIGQAMLNFVPRLTRKALSASAVPRQR
jgi:hypothetical protein